MSNSLTEMDRFDSSLWKVRMLVHLGEMDLKSIMDDEKLPKDPLTAKEELKSVMKYPKMGLARLAETVPSIDLVKFEKSEKAKDLIVLKIGNKVLCKITH